MESDFLTYSYDPGGPGHTTTQAYSIGTPILKLGVTNWMDLELGLALFNSLRQNGPTNTAGRPGGDVTRARGFGDTLLGAKINLFGNDGGDQSLALLPFVKIPTAAHGLGNDHLEFTLNAPYTIALSKPWSLTLEPNFGVLRNADNSRYRENYGFIANLNRPVFIDGLTAAAEIAVDISSERQEGTRVSFDPSLQYLLAKNLQIDVGVYLGLNKATPRYLPYTGISYRF
ncbi:MAG: transporter [Rhizobiales bacterium]|nr:transporter [Hyphomicrobiales bacterium]